MAPQKQRDENQRIIERVLARETPLEKAERSLRCPHGERRSLCLKCAGLTKIEIEKWNKERTVERGIHRGVLDRYVPVKISRNDCALTSRPPAAVPPPTQASEWYECGKCQHIVEVGSGNPETCLICGGPLVSVPAPFQGGNVSAEMFDPNSRVQSGGAGYLRIPPDSPRDSRADAPEWIDIRGIFLRTLRPNRAARAEEILRRFYLEEQTDTQIAESVGWTKDAVKKERNTLIQKGNEFFQKPPAKYPPSPAISERAAFLDSRSSLRTKHPPRAAVYERAVSSRTVPIKKAYPVSPTKFVAVCSPEPSLIRLHPIFESEGELYATKDGVYIPLSSLDGFLRQESAVPRNRLDRGQAAAD